MELNSMNNPNVAAVNEKMALHSIHYLFASFLLSLKSEGKL